MTGAALTQVENNLAFRFRVLSEKGLSWICGQLQRVRPTDFSDPYTLKDVTELGILYSLLFRWSKGPFSPQMRQIETHLVGVCDDPVLSQLARRSPSAYTSFFILYFALRAAGVSLPHYESACRAVHRLGYPAALEMLPFRKIEVEYFSWKAGLRPRPTGWNRLLESSTLGLSLNPIYLSTMEAYSITHALFYVGDFAGPCTALSDVTLKKAVQMTECLLVHYWRHADWDLTGELLLNQVALGLHSTPLFDAAAGALARAWRADGVLPGPHSSVADDAAADFENSFHTTLVGLMLTHAYNFRLAAEGHA